MLKLTADQTGDLGELIAATDLSRPVRGKYRRPLFKTTHLGGKYPNVDFIVDVLAADSTSLGFFFAQVKSTATASSMNVKLAISVDKDKFNNMVRIPTPTYLIGVDVAKEATYLVAANKIRKANVSSITKVYPLREDAVKIGLFQEVLAFWKANKPILQQTRFKDV